MYIFHPGLILIAPFLNPQTALVWITYDVVALVIVNKTASPGVTLCLEINPKKHAFGGKKQKVVEHNMTKGEVSHSGGQLPASASVHPGHPVCRSQAQCLESEGRPWPRS